jgi:hypothetical protein
MESNPIATPETLDTPVRTGRVVINFATGYFLTSTFMLLVIVVGGISGQSTEEGVLPEYVGLIGAIFSFLGSGIIFVNVLVSHFEKLAHTISNSK